MKILVTGATGYIGGRLTPLLLEKGHQVRVLVRDRGRIAGRSWAGDVEIAVGDLEHPDTLGPALDGIETAYYLVHSMYGGPGYARRDREAAASFCRAAREPGTLRHVVYLGGLLPSGRRVSRHLGSRAQVGRILRDNLPATEFRAGPIIGSGSASFEMVRYLTERLPVMVAPIWILNSVQPIGVRDVLSYLVSSAERDPMDVVEIGADRLTFKKMMEVFADVRGLRRVIFPLPVLAPRLAALWVGLVTPIPNSLAVPLIEGVVEPVLADTKKARSLFPDLSPAPYREAVRRAVDMTEGNRVLTRWSGALGTRNSRVPGNADEGAPRNFEKKLAHRHRPLAPPTTHEVSDREGMFREVRTLHVELPPESVFGSFSTLGGERGWLVWEWAWKIRGAMDSLVGGPGLRRGRRDPVNLLPGEVLDFWRVDAVDPPRLLRLRAEMKVPGKAWLQWEAVPEGQGTRLVQTAMFLPRGFFGAAYWYSLYPIHTLIFSDMARGIARDAARRASPHQRVPLRP